MSETTLVRACLDVMHCRRIMAWRSNSGSVTATYKGKKRYVRFSSMAGLSDICAILPGGVFLAVECKIGKNKPTDEQRNFLDAVKAKGGVALVIYSADQLMQELDVLLEPNGLGLVRMPV